MKKYLILLLVAVTVFVIPFNAKAATKKVLGKEYQTKNFVETLQEEELDIPANYKETNDQITIYLFRGKGCSYCRAYLTFMSNIAAEYGKYFKMVSFEVWNIEDNWNLMNQISYLKQGDIVQGVPYYIIGDKVFNGYASDYDEDIKKAIVDLYNTEKSKRADIFETAEKEGLTSIEELQKLYGEAKNGENETTSSNSSSENSSDVVIVLWTLGFVVVGTAAVIIFNNYKFNQLEKAIRSVKKADGNISKKSKKK